MEDFNVVNFNDVNAVGCSNGLVCFSDGFLSNLQNKIWILNLETKQVSWIYPINHSINESMCSIGFGLDISSNDYKIVIIHIYDHTMHYDNDFVRVTGLASGFVSAFPLATNIRNKRIHDCLKKKSF